LTLAHTHRRRFRVAPRWRLPVALLRAAWLLAVWMVVLAMFMLLRSPYNALWVAGTVAAVLWWHALRPGVRRNARERATLRLRPLPRWAVPYLVRALTPMFVANIAMLLLAVGLGLDLGNTGHESMRALQRQGTWGYVALATWLLAFAPVLEEMVCRGWLQHPLERRLGPAPGIAIAAAVFAALHMQPAGFANRFVLGAFAGYAVWVTGSLWAGVALHAANNLLAGLIGSLGMLNKGSAAAAKTAPAFHLGPVGIAILLLVVGLCVRSLVRIGRGMDGERRALRAAAAAQAMRAHHVRRTGGAWTSDERQGRGAMGQTGHATAAASLRALLEGIVDYAGLFPPAALSMPQAVATYAEARRGPDAWMLGRFVVPAARLAEFGADAYPHLPAVGEGEPWRVSALAAPHPAADLATIRAFNQEHAGRAIVDSVEIRADDPAALADAARQVPAGMTAYFELAPGAGLDALLSAVKESGMRAKIRTGGVTADAFPPPADVLRFIEACVRAGVPLKATAGLHHPLRAEHRLTYADDAPSGVMFGFLNVFLAAAFLRSGLDAESVGPLLEEGDPAALRFGDEGVEWRGHRLATAQLAAARGGFAASFGSCSFDEPVRDLKALDLL
jgi:membrane protease YdiL (CAAX protease family)